MSIIEIIVRVLRFVVPIFIGAMLARASYRSPKKDFGGSLLFRFPKFYIWFGAFLCLGTTGVLIWGFSLEGDPEYGWALFIAAFGYSAGLGYFMSGVNSVIRMNEKGLEKTTMFGVQKRIRFDEVNFVKMEKWTNCLKIKSKHETIRAHKDLIGYQELRHTLEEKSSISRDEMNLY